MGGVYDYVQVNLGFDATVMGQRVLTLFGYYHLPALASTRWDSNSCHVKINAISDCAIIAGQ